MFSVGAERSQREEELNMFSVYTNTIQKGTDYTTEQDLYPDTNNPANEAIITALDYAGLKYTTCIKLEPYFRGSLVIGDVVTAKRYSRTASDEAWILQTTQSYTLIADYEDVTFFFDSYLVYDGGAVKFTLQVTSANSDTVKVIMTTFDEHKVNAVQVNSQTPNTLQDISDELAGDAGFLAAVAAKILSTPAVPLANDANGRVDVSLIEGVDATNQIRRHSKGGRYG